MEILTPEKVAKPLGIALQAAFNGSYCKNKKEAAVVVASEGDILSVGIKNVRGGRKLLLCRGECLDAVNCLAEHAIELAIETAIRAGRDMHEAYLFHVILQQDEFRIPREVECEICQKMIFAVGIKTVLWNHLALAGSGIRCVAHTAEELRARTNMHHVQGQISGNVFSLKDAKNMIIK